MAITEHGDFLLESNELQFKDGDISASQAKEQLLGAIVGAHPGNFIRKPTIGPGLNLSINGPLNATDISRNIINSVRLDGWEIEEMDISNGGDDPEITIIEANKLTDNTEGLI